MSESRSSVRKQRAFAPSLRDRAPPRSADTGGRRGPRAQLVRLACVVALLGCDGEDGPRELGGMDGSVDAGTHPELDAEGPRDASDSAGDARGSEDASGGNPEPGRLAGITALHNAVRERVGATPALPSLAWSPAVAEVARAYAQTLAARCAPMLAHSSAAQRMNYGENLVAFSDSSRDATHAPGTAAEVVALWESERACYSYGPFQSGVHAGCTAACADYGGCGHYTQMVWRATRAVGCGIAECKDGQTLRSYWVCHYDPAGNVRGAPPY